MSRHQLTLFWPLLTLPFLSACGPEVTDACGALSGVVPSAADVAPGALLASLDQADFTASGTWGDGPNGSIDAGLLSLIIPRDESGTLVSELVGRGAFPICIPLGERSDKSGNATYDSTYVTDANHTGMVAILAEEEGHIVGRFEVNLRSGNGDMTAFENGRFRLPRR